jgi:Holliday junction resolvase RusA-like endonuclease
MIEPVEFRVDGTPATQGSKRAMKSKAGKPFIIDANPRSLHDWRAAVRTEAQRAMEGRELLGADGLALRLTCVFSLQRPKSRPERLHYPDKRPDLSKLVRAAEDAMKGIVWRDDSQVCEQVARKRYAGDLGGSMRPGVDIRVSVIVE